MRKIHGQTTLIVSKGLKIYIACTFSLLFFPGTFNMWEICRMSDYFNAKHQISPYISNRSTIDRHLYIITGGKYTVNISWTSILYVHSRTRNNYVLIMLWNKIKYNMKESYPLSVWERPSRCVLSNLYDIQGVLKRLNPFFIFLGAQCVESGVSCTDCY